MSGGVGGGSRKAIPYPDCCATGALRTTEEHVAIVITYRIEFVEAYFPHALRLILRMFLGDVDRESTVSIWIIRWWCNVDAVTTQESFGRAIAVTHNE